MRTIFTLVSFLTNLTISAQSLKNDFKKKDSLIKEVQVFKSKDDPFIVAVIAVTAPDWWETLSVLKLKNNKILWQASFDSMPVEQSIRSVKQIKLHGLQNLFFQVYGQTHMGNGFYYLYELQGRKMVLKASTRAVDRNRDGGYKIKGDWREYDRVFTNDTLTVRYRDVNNDGIEDIELSGQMEVLYNEKKVKSFPVRKVLVYNKRKTMFVEDEKWRKGFEKDDD
jgi:hypothetical protein